MSLQGKLTVSILIVISVIISCQKKPNVTLIGNLKEGFEKAKELNRKVLLIVGTPDCGKCTKYIEFISNDNKIRESLENDFVVIYEGGTDSNIGAKLTRCVAMPMPYVFKNNGQLIAFGDPKKNKSFSDTLDVGMGDMPYLELFNLSITQTDYKKMVSKSMQTYLFLSDTTSKTEDLKNAYKKIKESIKIKPYCYNLQLAHILAKRLETAKKESQLYLAKMKSIIQPIDRFIYADLLKQHFNLSKEDIKKINPDKNLKLSIREINLGKIKRKNKCDFLFKILNDGKQPVIIRTIRASCTCVEMDFSKEPILPGKTKTISGVFEAKHKGNFSRILFIHTNSKRSPILNLLLKGTVI
jgi:hypothetical protein